jgi:hypothetical protein
MKQFGMFLAIAALACAGCSASLTELVVIVDTDITTPSAPDTIRIDVVEPSGRTDTTTAAIGGSGAVTLPVSVGVVWRGGGLSPIVITATASANGMDVVSRRVVTGFVSGETRVVRLDLVQRCVGTTCGADESCGPSGCVSANLAPETLPRFDGTTPALSDGSVDDGSVDVDAGDDAHVDVDAAMVDAGPMPDMGPPRDVGPLPDMGPVDVGVDAPMPCTLMCTLDHATATCSVSHTCVITSCDTGYSNCDMMDATGCERSIRTLSDCGGCGIGCSSTAGTTTCADGTCRIATCAVINTADCNHDIADGCEANVQNDANNCGTCGMVCTGGLRCRMGMCR